MSARGGKVWWKKYLTMAQIVQFWINIGGLLLWLYFDYITPGGCAGVYFIVLRHNCIEICFLNFVCLQAKYGLFAFA